jgi:hypothetical protein
MRVPAIFAVLAVGVLASVSWTNAAAAKAPKSIPVAVKQRPIAATVPLRSRAPSIASHSAAGKALPAPSRHGLRSTAPQLRGAGVLGGPAKYDAKKGAVTGGAVMVHKR